MFFLIAYPLFILLFLHAKGTICFHKMIRVIYVSLIFLLPLSPFFLILIRYMYKKIDYLLFYKSLPLIFMHIFLLPVALITILFFLLRTFSWWKTQDIIIVAVFVELIINISNSIMGYSFFSFADVLVIPLVKMASIQLFICFMLLQNIIVYTGKIADNVAAHILKQNLIDKYILIISKGLIIIFFIASFFNSVVVMYFSNLSFYLEAYVYSLFSVIIGWGSLSLCYYAKSKLYNNV